MDALALLVFIIFIPTNLLMSLVVFINNKKSWTNRLFALLIVVFTLYLVVNSFAYFPYGYESQLFFSRSIMAIASIINLLVFAFLQIFPSFTLNLNKKVLIAFTAVTALIFGLAISTPLIFESIVISGNNVITPVAGKLMPVFLLHTLLLIGWGLVAVIKHYKMTRGQDREKIGYVLLSFFLLFTLILIFNFILPVFFQFSLAVPLLPLYLLTFNIIVGYAIIKRRLLDIKSLVARSVTYLLLILSIALIYAGILFLIGRLFLHVELSTEAFILSISLAVILALSFQPLKSAIAKITDKFFYQDFYNSEKLLHRLSLIMASTLHLEDLVRKLLNEIVTTLKVTKGMVILIEDAKIYQVLSEGYSDTPTLDEKDIELLMSEKKILLTDELQEGQLKEIMKKYGFSLVSSFIHEGKILGLVGLGDKLSGENFSDKDVTVINIFSPEAAVAIQNAKSYEEIRRFNITLEDEVESATQRLVKANEKLQDLDKLKDEFVSIASHELRTPMVSIKNYVWMTLAGKGGKISRKQKFYLDRAYDSANRMTKLINDLLNISRIESGRIILNVEKVTLPELADQIMSEVKPRADQLDVKLIMTKDAHKKGSETKVSVPQIIADKDKVAEVLVNLLGNSLKFTPPKGKITVSFEVDEKDKKVILRVEDTGVGLSKDQIPKLFKKFGMIKESYHSKSEAAQGTGLGLYVSKSIIELHGGKIWVESAGKDKGSTFSFSLPIYSEVDLHHLQKKFQSGADAGIIRTTLVSG